MNVGIYTDNQGGTVGLSATYLQFCTMFGIPHMINVYNYETYLNGQVPLDLLIVPGGSDIMFNNDGPPNFHNGRANSHYEYLDAKFLNPLLKQTNRGFPILGICRGFQAINCMLGGTLYQHVIGHNPNYTRDSLTQKVFVKFNNQSIYKYNVNSIHHQAVNVLGEGLIPFAYARSMAGCPSLRDRQNIPCQILKKDETWAIAERPGFVEGYYSDLYDIVGVQWHPEEFNCELTMDLVNNMIEKCKNDQHLSDLAPELQA